MTKEPDIQYLRLRGQENVFTQGSLIDLCGDILERTSTDYAINNRSAH